MKSIKCFEIITMLFWMLPLYGIRDPFLFDTPTLAHQPIMDKIIDCNAQQSSDENVSSEKKELAVGDTINACKVVSISECELVLQNQEGHLHKICLPSETLEEN